MKFPSLGHPSREGKVYLRMKERFRIFYRDFSGFWDRRGFCIVLCLCFLLVGLTAYFTRTAEPEPVSPPSLTVYPSPTPSPVPAAVQTATILPTATPLPLKLPAEEAQLGLGYSAGQLVYHETLDEWRIHDGVDYLGQADTPVRAVMGGRVERVYEDPFLGNCLLLVSTDGYRCLYASLGPELLVEQGAAVSAGQTLGFMGDSALCERAEGFHVHVELHKDGRCLSGQLPLP